MYGLSGVRIVGSDKINVEYNLDMNLNINLLQNH